MATEPFRCHNCRVCLGKGCIDELPGMGGVAQNENFILNCSDWSKLYNEEGSSKIPQLSKEEILSLIRYAPVTGAVENIGWHDEKDFYSAIFSALYDAGVNISLGDGCPDEKLLYGIQAVQTIQAEKDEQFKAAVFLKPYPDENLLHRIEWSLPVASHIGIDIDAYNIVTMRNKARLEKKSASQIRSLMKHAHVPFVVKGVFTRDDIELVKEAKPDVIYISNHGGRIETRTGSTAAMLKETASMLQSYCGEIWVDGGIRCKKDIELAHYYGAKQVLIARPFIKKFCYGGTVGISDFT